MALGGLMLMRSTISDRMHLEPTADGADGGAACEGERCWSAERVREHDFHLHSINTIMIDSFYNISHLY